MATIPYFLDLSAAVAANGAQTLSYPVPANEKLHVNEIIVQSTGAFQVEDISDSRGVHFTNATSSNPIPGTFFQVGGSPNLGVRGLPVQLDIDGNVAINIVVKDTSAAPNTIRFLLVGSKEIGNQ